MLRIIADSTCDISKEDARKMGIQIVPISVRFGDEEFLDGVEITHEEFYTRLAECDELPKTSQPSPDAADIAAACTEMSKYIKLTAVVGSLKYLKMGGRLSGAAAFAGTMLHITPVVSIEDGKVVVIGKTRGKKAAEKLMHDKLTKDGLSLTRDFMFGHINCSESLETFINKSLIYISDVNGNVGVSSIGCSVGTHVGPGTYGIAYVEAAESGMHRKDGLILIASLF